MVPSGTDSPYQSFGDSSRHQSAQSLPPPSTWSWCANSHGQYHDHVLYKQTRGHTLSLLFLTVTLWEWCYCHHIFPVAGHVSMEDNVLADELSRRTNPMHEWELNAKVFDDLCHRWGTPAMDVFATRTNRKCPLYASRAGRGQGSMGDAFMIPWTMGLLYLFPPFPLVQRTLVKLRQESAEAILVAPF